MLIGHALPNSSVLRSLAFGTQRDALSGITATRRRRKTERRKMPDAAYYRMKAKECFDHALSAKGKAEANQWRERGREYGELAIAVDAESSKGAAQPAKLATEE